MKQIIYFVSLIICIFGLVLLPFKTLFQALVEIFLILFMIEISIRTFREHNKKYKKE